MQLIAHRGNIDGKSELENSPKYVIQAIQNGFDAEVDIWLIGTGLYLGHDQPTHLINLTFLQQYQNKLWCHAKNLAALEFLLNEKLHCFWHQNDDFTLTSQGFIWTFPEKEISINSVIVTKTKAETKHYLKTNCYGICGDFWIDLEK